MSDCFNITSSPQSLSDGLYLRVHPKGGKYWNMKYHTAVHPHEVAFDAYPAVSVKLARERRDEARQQLARGRTSSK